MKISSVITNNANTALWTYVLFYIYESTGIDNNTKRTICLKSPTNAFVETKYKCSYKT